MKPPKKFAKWQVLRRKQLNFERPEDTIQRFNHEPFNLATSYKESKVKPEKNPRVGKLSPNWEGPFWVTTNLDNRAYQLQELDGKAIPRTWNTTHLKFYFS